MSSFLLQAVGFLSIIPYHNFHFPQNYGFIFLTHLSSRISLASFPSCSFSLLIIYRSDHLFTLSSRIFPTFLLFTTFSQLIIYRSNFLFLLPSRIFTVFLLFSIYTSLDIYRSCLLFTLSSRIFTVFLLFTTLHQVLLCFIIPCISLIISTS